MLPLRSARLISRLRLAALAAFCASGMALLTGCGAGTVMGGGNPTPVAISASPASIAAGGSSVLSVTTSNATQVTVSGSDGSNYTMGANGGSQTVTPAATTTYTAVAVGTSGGKVSATAVVAVTTSAAPTVTISASPASINAGAASVLTVAASNATQVTVTGTDGSSYTLAATGGTQSVTPAATTTYTVVATGAGGKASMTAVVTVAAAAGSPAVTIMAGSASISAGASSVLTVAASNATQVVITGSDGSSYSLAPTGGTQSVTPAVTTTYTAVATGAGGAKATAMTTVTVAAAAGAPTVAISANPSSIPAGGSTVLTVTATNATQVTITGSDGSSSTLPASGQMQPITPAATTTYTAVATGAGGAKATAMTTVTVIPAATVSIMANPASVASPGGTATLTVVAANATQVTLKGSDGSTYTLAPTGGTQAVTPAATTTYTAAATGTGGAVVMASATVTVGSGATVSIAANPTTIAVGGSSVLSVTAMNAAQVTITGTDGSTYTLPPAGGTQTVSPTTTATYTAIATGTGAGGTAVKATATVTVTAAPTVALSASPASVSPGGASVLTATAVNATQVMLTGSDGSTYTLSPTGGTQSVTLNATTTYTATASGAGGVKATAMATVTVGQAATANLSASPSSIAPGGSSVITVSATNATQVTLTGSDGTSYTLPPAGGSETVTPTATTTYTAKAVGSGASASATTTITVGAAGNVSAVQHVIFMLQENHSFDNYFGMLNPYRAKNNLNVGDDGKTYSVDGIDDKLTKISNQDDAGDMFAPFPFKSTCVDDLSSAWLESYGDVSRYDFTPTRKIVMDGFVHTAEGYAKNCTANGGCAGTFSDFTGQRSMGYYDENFLNYYYYMASQFALSDRWFSPVSSKSIDNRIATFTGGTTQGLTHDPGNDGLSQLAIPTIFAELSTANVSWKIYYTVTQGACLSEDDCSKTASAEYPAINFTALQDSYKYLYENPTGAACVAPTVASKTAVNDPTNSFCIDPTHIAPLSTYTADLMSGTLPSFAFIEAGYGVNDEHPGSGQSILSGQAEVASIVNALMASTSWSSSVFFLSYDEGGGPYDHVPPVPSHSNDYTLFPVGSATTSAGIPDISSIAVNPDTYGPCVPATPGTPTLHCDLDSVDPGASPADAAAITGFASQLGFRLPNMVISPFTRKHYVSHVPMDHTAILKFVESRFIGPSAHLTARDAAQPDLLDFFDFNAIPWATPPATIPAPASPATLGYDPCTPTTFVGP